MNLPLPPDESAAPVFPGPQSVSSLPPKRWTGVKRIALVGISVYLLWLLVQIRPIPLEPGPRTTVITEPHRPDGTLHYAAALNNKCSRHVTSENNAVVLLLEVLGADMLDPDIREDYFDRLGLSLPLPRRKIFQSLEELYGDDYQTLDRVHQQLDRAITTSWTPSEYPLLARWLDLNDETLKVCRQASRMDHYFDPLIPPRDGTLLETTIPLTQEMRLLSPLLGLQVTRHLGTGDTSSALEDAAVLHRLSRLIAQHPLFISQLVAYSYSATAVVAEAALVQSNVLTAEQIRRQRARLPLGLPFPELADLLDQGERYAILDSLQRQSLAEWQPNTVLEQENQRIDQFVAALREPDAAHQRAAFAAVRREMDNSPQYWELLTAPGEVLAARRAQQMSTLSRLSVDQLIHARTREMLRCQLTETGYAIAEFRARHGRLPDSLTALVPDLLPEVPQDPFSRGPVQFVPIHEQKNFRLYSVGENGIDEQGRFGRGIGDDLSFGLVDPL